MGSTSAVLVKGTTIRACTDVSQQTTTNHSSEPARGS